MTKFIYNDGGRVAAGYKGHASDCVARAIAIATEIPYEEVYEEINRRSKRERCKDKSSARHGVNNALWKKYCRDLGMKWVPTMHIGTGCQVHLNKEELPGGWLIVSVRKHVVAFVDGVIHDTHDHYRDKCVYGYFVCDKRRNYRK